MTTARRLDHLTSFKGTRIHRLQDRTRYLDWFTPFIICCWNSWLVVSYVLCRYIHKLGHLWFLCRKKSKIYNETFPVEGFIYPKLGLMDWTRGFLLRSYSILHCIILFALVKIIVRTIEQIFFLLNENCIRISCSDIISWSLISPFSNNFS